MFIYLADLIVDMNEVACIDFSNNEDDRYNISILFKNGYVKNVVFNYYDMHYAARNDFVEAHNAINQMRVFKK